MLIFENDRLDPIPVGWEEPLRRFELALRAKGRAERTIDTRIRHLRTLARGIGCDSPTSVTSNDLIEWSGQQNWESETRHSYHSSIRLFFRFYLPESESPAGVLGSVRRPVPPPRPAPDPAIQKALDTAPPRTQLILRLAAELGLRAMEISTLRFDDFTRDETGWATVRIFGKGGQIRELPVPPKLAGKIFSNSPHSGWIFPGNINGHLSARWIGKLATKALPEPWTLHTLRHRFATTAYNRSRHDLIAVQQAMGHKSITTTQRYTQTALNIQDLMKTTSI